VSWEVEYKPKSIKEMCLPNYLYRQLERYERTGDIPNLIFYGEPGLGKTTTAKLLGDTEYFEYYRINCGEVQSRAELKDALKGMTSVNMFGTRRLVVFDEFHNINPKIQSGLTDLLEQDGDTNSFIIITNEFGKIIKQIKSRCFPIDFNVGYVEKNKKSPKYGEWLPYEYTDMTTDDWVKTLHKYGRSVARRAGYKITQSQLNRATDNNDKKSDVRNFLQSLENSAKGKN